MERTIIEDLNEWRTGKNRKPLLLKGARQVGKTWVMKEFGRRFYKNTAYVTFYNNKRMGRAFEDDYDIERILMNISAECKEIILPEETLIILDEIQEAPKALESLKYFCENAPQYHVIAAGSLLGVAIHSGVSYPVGKVDEMNMYPMSFYEFLLANGQEMPAKLIEDKKLPWMADLKEKYIHWLKNYLYVGGMPEIVANFAENRDYKAVRKMQKALLNNYEKDFGKHSERELQLRISQVWNSIPSQLSKENKKFFFGGIKKGARMSDFELAIQWLCNSGLVHKVNRVTKPGVPLKAYEELSAFKLYMVDVGLVSAMCNISSKALLGEMDMFVEFKGALTENYVLQELKCSSEYPIYYYSKDTSDFELDFLLDTDDGPAPIEVKASENLRAKSFKTYCTEHNPEKAYRISLSDYREESWMTNIPLYAVETIC